MSELNNEVEQANRWFDDDSDNTDDSDLTNSSLSDKQIDIANFWADVLKEPETDLDEPKEETSIEDK